MRTLLALFFCCFICIKSFAQPCNMQGVYTVGAGGNYLTITAAVTSLKTNGVGNPVILELLSTYNSSGETFPLVFSGIPCIDETKTVTIRPSATATNLSITSANTTATIDLNNARFIRIDGRAGGTGSSIALTVSNSTVTGNAIRFINDASSNQLQFLNVYGNNASVTNGIISFLTSNQSITNGNSNNTINNCNISRLTGNAANCIYSFGTNNKKNSNNRVLNCNISDFFAASVGTHGIAIEKNSNAWEISGNSFYHTIQRSFPAATGAISINDTTSSGFIIENNFIGGSAPLCAGTKINYGSFYRSIYILAGTDVYTSIQNNKIANIGINLTSDGYVAAIYMGMGKFKCGDIAGNTIGSLTDQNSITIATNSFFNFYGIVAGTPDPANSGVDSCYIKNNIISGIAAFQTTPNTSYGTIIAVYLQKQRKGFANISDNRVGNPASGVGISNNTYNPDNNVTGILAEIDQNVPAQVRPVNIISNNQVCNLYGSATGISLVGANAKVTGNTIKKLYSLPAINDLALGVSGITVGPVGVQTGGAFDSTFISGNTIHSLTCSGNSFQVKGIDVKNYSGCTVSNNFIHSLQSSAGSVNKLTGIAISGSGEKIYNNMIRLGIDTLGNAVANNQEFFGINLNSPNAFVLNNSVYIGGSGTENSAALLIPAGVISPGLVTNNIFHNSRFITGGSTRNHYAVKLDNASINTQFFNYNIYYASGNRAHLGIYRGVEYDAIINWRAATRADSNSIFYSPNFINPVGDATAVNLHLANPTPAEGSGNYNALVTVDFDNELRSSLSPNDIGADAGNYIFKDGDAPILSHEAFLGQPVSSLFTYQLKITDNGSGVDTTANKKPRMWFRKKFPTISSWTSTEGTLSSGTISGGTWNFIPDFPASGIPLAAGDSIQYYFVAQDKGSNVGYSNIPGAAHIDVSTQVTAPAIPLRLLIYGQFPDTVYVGVGQTYTSLSNDNGFFEASHKNMFDTTHQNATVIITSDLLFESGTHNYTTLYLSGSNIKFITNTATEKRIKNVSDLNRAMISLVNISNLTVDGSVNGSGKWLRFINGHTNPAAGHITFQMGDKTINCTIRNCIFESNSTAGGMPVVLLGSGMNKNLRFEKNIIRGIEPGSGGASGLPSIGMMIGANGADSIFVRDNDIINFGIKGISIISNIDGKVIVDSNHFFYNSSIPSVGTRYVIDVATATAVCNIQNNFIGGSARFCGGTPWTFSSAASNADFIALKVYNDDDSSTAVVLDNNTVQNFRFNNFGYHFKGVYVNNGSIKIRNNLIGSITDPSSITNWQDIYGIWGSVAMSAPITVNPYLKIENNTIAGFTAPYVVGISFEAKHLNITGNRIANLTASGSTPTITGCIGIRAAAYKGKVEGNTVADLKSITPPCNIAGINAGHAVGTDSMFVLRNKVFGLESNTVDGTITGIQTGNGLYNVQNNQVNLTNGSNTQPSQLIGIAGGGYGGVNRRSVFYYNTIRIGGSAATGTVKTYGCAIYQDFPVASFRNNLILNERTGGTGHHLALGAITANNPPIPSWPAGISANNLFITADTNVVNEWRTNGAVSMSQWRILSKGDTASYAASYLDVRSDSLFISPATNDLNINTTRSQSWYVNGKGIPISTISGDYDSPVNVRSTSIINGSTDIGSDEFNTNSPAPALIVSGDHVNGGTESFLIGTRKVATITWGPSGTLPVLGAARFYSGVWPNDTTNNNTVHGARYMSSYWDIPATGGDNYTYSLTLHYDSSMLGKVTDATTMVINKREATIAGSWQVIQPTLVNGAGKTITIDGQTSFSEFTVTDLLANLSAGIPVPDLVINNQVANPATIGTGQTLVASFTASNNGLVAAGANKAYFYLSPDNTLTPGNNGDLLLGQSDIPAINAGNNSGTLNKSLSIPCNIPAGTYTLFFVADALNNIFESDENNNVSTVSLPVIIVATNPVTPVISANPGTVICPPGIITLTANSSECIGCSYTWSLGPTAPEITVNTSGTYSVIATNTCGNSASGSIIVTVIDAIPQPGAITGSTAVCQGSSQTYSVTAVSGATSYTWTLPSGWTGTSTTSSITVTAGSTGGNITVKANNNCGSSTEQTLAVTISSIIAPGAITGSTAVCPGSSQTYSVAEVAGATSYTWTLPSGWTGTSTTNSITVTAGSTDGNITVKANNNCGSSTEQILAVTITSTIAQPGAITGSTAVCQGSSQTYSVAEVAGATNYTWTLPSGWTGASTTNSITVVAGSTGGNITVKANNNCGSSTEQILAVTITSIMAQPGAITGSTAVCQGSSQTYSVATVSGATSYTWTLPSGWTGTSTTNSINVTAGSAGGNITVKANNNCGSSTEQTLAVTISSTAQPAAITGSTAVCLGSSQTYSVATVSGATSYTWTLPSGWTGTSTTNSITVTAGSAGGNITVKANDNCGSSTDRVLAVTVTAVPSQPGIISGNGSVNIGETLAYSINQINGATSYNWTLTGGGNIMAGQGSNTISVNWVTQGNYVLSVSAGNNCGSSSNQTLNVVSAPPPNSDNPFEIKVGPIPSAGEYILTAKRLAGKKIDIIIMTNLGQTIYTVTENVIINDFTRLIDLRNMPNGIFYLKILIDNKAYIKTLIKQN